MRRDPSYPPQPFRPCEAVLILRCILCLLAACVGLQGLSISAQRIHGQEHYHVGASVSGHAHHEAPHAHGDDDGPDDDGHDDHDLHHAAAGHAHGHDYPAHHDHAAGEEGVVYVAHGDTSPSPGHLPAVTRTGADLDGVIAYVHPVAERAGGRRWPPTGASVFRSQSHLPPERPPRA